MGLAPLLQVEMAADGRLVAGRVVSFSQTGGPPPRPDKKNGAAELIHQLGLEDFPDSNAVAADGTIIIR